MSRNWESLGLSVSLLTYLRDIAGFKKSTPVQASAIPLLLSNKDVAVESATGSGKTLAYVLPLVDRILSKTERKSKQAVKALVLLPTRELALQIYEVFTSLLESSEELSELIGCLCYVGGREEAFESKQVSVMKQVNLIVVGTPARIRHSLSLSLSQCDLVVLDEADRLFETSLEADTCHILSKIPRQRRTFLFSATLSSSSSTSSIIQGLVRKGGLRNPVIVRVKQDRGGGDEDEEEREEEGDVMVDLPVGLTNYFYVSTQDKKLAFLIDFILASHEGNKIVVFFLTCASVEFHFSVLFEFLSNKRKNINISRLHGQMKNNNRLKSLEEFKNGINKGGEIAVLCATDVAARGLDICDVSFIVQFDCPQDPSFFVHRVGRTARGGKDGDSLVLLLPNEYPSYLNFLEKSRGIPPLIEWKNIEGSIFPADWIRESLTSKKREILLKATAAFVSFVRAYQEHKLNYIFSLKELDIGQVAHSFGVLRIPRVREILGKKISGFVQFDGITPDQVPFEDKKRECARQKLKADELIDKEKEIRDSSKKQKIIKEAKILQSRNDKSRTRSEKRVAKRQNRKDEWDDLANEERLAKKLRKGKISKEEYERQLVGSDGEASDDD